MSTMPDQDLGEADYEEDTDFPPPERKIITQPYDFSIGSLVTHWNENTLILPEIQREYVWDNGRASRLVESLLLNIPIPVLYFAETKDARWEIIDGHQRVRSLVRFTSNEFPLTSLAILSELNRKRFHQIPAREQRYLERRAIRAIVISHESHPNMKFETFERLNTGAVVLNAQEIRNSLFRGPFNQMLRELVKTADFRICLGSRTPRRRMVDEELVLRFFGLRASIQGYRPPLKRALNSYMSTVQYADAAELADLRMLFDRTFAVIREILGSSAFRITDRRGKPTEPGVNRALFDAQTLAFSWIVSDTDAIERRTQITTELSKLFGSRAFVDAISRATGDRARTTSRLRSVLAALDSAGVETAPPSLF